MILGGDVGGEDKDGDLGIFEDVYSCTIFCFTNCESETTIHTTFENAMPLLARYSCSFCKTHFVYGVTTKFFFEFSMLLANKVDAFLCQWIPGTACAVIAILAALFNSLVNQRQWWAPFRSASSFWGEFLFLMFFASIGIGANLQSILQLGPTSLLFSVLALSIHLMVTILGSLPLHVELEDVWYDTTQNPAPAV